MFQRRICSVLLLLASMSAPLAAAPRSQPAPAQPGFGSLITEILQGLLPPDLVQIGPSIDPNGGMTPTSSPSALRPVTGKRVSISDIEL